MSQEYLRKAEHEWTRSFMWLLQAPQQTFSLGFRECPPSLGLDNWGSCESLANQSAAQKSKPPYHELISTTVPYQLSTCLHIDKTNVLLQSARKVLTNWNVLNSHRVEVQFNLLLAEETTKAKVPGLGWSPVSLEWSTYLNKNPGLVIFTIILVWGKMNQFAEWPHPRFILPLDEKPLSLLSSRSFTFSTSLRAAMVAPAPDTSRVQLKKNTCLVVKQRASPHGPRLCPRRRCTLNHRGWTHSNIFK